MDTFSRKERSRIMACVKSTANRSTEDALVQVMKRAKITGWRRGYLLFGRPDFVFPRQRVAVFVDGCFWHGHPQYCRVPRAHRAYWLRKIGRNMERDKMVTRILENKGWKVIRIWENAVALPVTVVRLRRVLS